MLAALLLAWRETRPASPLAPGPGRAASSALYAASPVEGGHAAHAPATDDAAGGTTVPEDVLKDAPADSPRFAPRLALPPLTAGWPAGARAPSASPAAPGRTSEEAPSARKSTAVASRRAVRTTSKAKTPPPGAHPPAQSAAAPDAPRPRPAPAARAEIPRPSKTAAPQQPPRAPRSDAAPQRRRASAVRAAPFDLFRPSPAAVRRSQSGRASRPPRFKPPRIDRALGPAAIRPPPSDVRDPTLAELSPRQPLAKADGKPARWSETPLPRLEETDPDDAALDCRKRDGHWHVEDERRVYHAGVGRGLAFEDAWLWLTRLERRWWALPDAAHAPWLRHRDRWWVRDEGVWFVLHEGEPWAWRHFSRWEADGLIHPASGTVIVYSADYARAAVLTPGDGAVLFDAQSGVELARWAEHELPPRWRLPPESLTLPRGI